MLYVSLGVAIAGVDIRDVTQHSLRRAVGMVPQVGSAVCGRQTGRHKTGTGLHCFRWVELAVSEICEELGISLLVPALTMCVCICLRSLCAYVPMCLVCAFILMFLDRMILKRDTPSLYPVHLQDIVLFNDTIMQVRGG